MYKTYAICIHVPFLSGQPRCNMHIIKFPFFSLWTKECFHRCAACVRHLRRDLPVSITPVPSSFTLTPKIIVCLLSRSLGLIYSSREKESQGHGCGSAG